MAGSKLFVLLILLLVVFSKLECRPLDHGDNRKLESSDSKNLTRIHEALQERWKGLKAMNLGDHEDVASNSYYYDSKRLSPGGPDPKHH